jgi:hypothetical protein
MITEVAPINRPSNRFVGRCLTRHFMARSKALTNVLCFVKFSQRRRLNTNIR